MVFRLYSWLLAVQLQHLRGPAYFSIPPPSIPFQFGSESLYGHKGSSNLSHANSWPRTPAGLNFPSLLWATPTLQSTFSISETTEMARINPSTTSPTLSLGVLKHRLTLRHYPPYFSTMSPVSDFMIRSPHMRQNTTCLVLRRKYFVGMLLKSFKSCKAVRWKAVQAHQPRSYWSSAQGESRQVSIIWSWTILRIRSNALSK